MRRFTVVLVAFFLLAGLTLPVQAEPTSTSTDAVESTVLEVVEQIFSNIFEYLFDPLGEDGQDSASAEGETDPDPGTNFGPVWEPGG